MSIFNKKLAIKHLEDQQTLLIKSINNQYKGEIARIKTESKEIYFSTQQIKGEIENEKMKNTMMDDSNYNAQTLYNKIIEQVHFKNQIQEKVV